MDWSERREGARTSQDTGCQDGAWPILDICNGEWCPGDWTVCACGIIGGKQHSFGHFGKTFVLEVGTVAEMVKGVAFGYTRQRVW